MAEPIIRIEYYHNPEPKNPKAYTLYTKRMCTLKLKDHATIVYDSVTYMEIAARFEAMYVLNKDAVGQAKMQWWSHATQELENELAIRVGSMQTNVLVLAHIDDSKSDINGATLRMPMAPGRLRSGLAGGFSEIYHMVEAVDAKGVATKAVQTQRDQIWIAATQYDVPNLCPPIYKATGLDKYTEPIHALVYSDPGGGKSTFAATWPKPMLVICFDNPGKDRPYIKRGDAGPVTEWEFGHYREVFKKVEGTA